jgi:hypothetical protein
VKESKGDASGDRSIVFLRNKMPQRGQTVCTHPHLRRRECAMAKKVCVKAAAISSAILWGGSVATVAAINAIRPSYGREFLRWTSSIYPGYKAEPTLRQAAVAGGYAALDGAACGALFALLYNCFA